MPPPPPEGTLPVPAGCDDLYMMRRMTLAAAVFWIVNSFTAFQEIAVPTNRCRMTVTSGDEGKVPEKPGHYYCWMKSASHQTAKDRATGRPFPSLVTVIYLICFSWPNPRTQSPLLLLLPLPHLHCPSLLRHSALRLNLRFSLLFMMLWSFKVLKMHRCNLTRIQKTCGTCKRLALTRLCRTESIIKGWGGIHSFSLTNTHEP